MEELKVMLLEVSTIVPATPTTPHFLQVSTLDLMQKRNCMPYLQRVAFYGQGGFLSDAIAQLKRSLSLVLVDFYPVAGRLVVNSEGRPEIHCNDAGVEFCEAASDALLGDIDYTQPNDLFHELIQRGNYEVAAMGDDVPLLSIQVTKFGCGGMCIAWAFDHIVADGTSIWHFMTSWAEVCRGQKLSRPPCHNRQFEKEHKQFLPLTTEDTTAAPFSYTFTDMSKGAIARTFRFSEEEVETLKAATLEDKATTKFSSFEVLSAHIWRAITKARGLEKSRKTTYSVACNVRGKLTPPMSETYFGNAVLMPFAETTVDKLVASGGLSYAAGLVNDTIKKFSLHDILMSVRDYKQNTKNPLGLGIDENAHVWHGGSLRLPLYEVDFGWGKALAVKNVRCLWDGFCYFDPTPNGGRSADITICLLPHTMDKFSQLVKICDP